MTAIATFALVALDCPDPAGLARFYGAITGWEVDGEPPELIGDDDGWVQLRAPGGGATIAFQKVSDHRPPQWPGAEHPQQAHLDFDVPDLDAAEERLLAIGARKHEVQPGESFRVYLDPAGHPFCLVQS
ncbi:VOC family protein [Pseudonocardia petroleophila]|uniref:VOC family protein n=1 Tax=Pseudonocardia petroleophila TaxID=37331 RepID=A0A7G7MER7_9PSEU|nr:VOC family protein [Pseudonocardia petroleophila]QNG51278.1 VOC family protein [Pseudonocardia petroleophila]